MGAVVRFGRPSAREPPLSPSVFALLAVIVSSPDTPQVIQEPEVVPLTVPRAHCAAARSVFGDDWTIVPGEGTAVRGGPNHQGWLRASPVADVCGATACVGVDLVTGGITRARRIPPVVQEPPVVRDALMKAFGVTCPEPSALDEQAPCRALSVALKFPAERAATFVRGFGPKARWLVNEVFGDDPMYLTARTHIYDAATRRHLGSVAQTELTDAPELEWVTDVCALVSMPFASSDTRPKRLLCHGKNRLVPTVAKHEVLMPGPKAAVALSDTRLAMWHVDEDMSTLRVISLPDGKEITSSELPFTGWESAMWAGAKSLFGTPTHVVVFADAQLGALHVFDPVGRRVLRAWKFDGCGQP